VDAIEVIDGGFFTTVQDLGRYGYQRYGVPVSGAMDLFALRVANLLVGNPQSAAALEITLAGPQLRFLADAVVVITGADLQPQIDDRPVPTWRPFAAPDGAVLSFGAARDGLRAYLGIAGGIDVPVVLGSRSTFVKGGIGGVEGRPLRSGDRVASSGRALEQMNGRTFPQEHVPAYGHDHTVRVILGLQEEAFTADGVATFLSAAYVVTPKSDRIGCRLAGPPVPHTGSPDIISDGNPFGAVQIAGDGLPIVLLADRGTTGGYTKLATVISVDLGRLAQALPGDRVSFRAVSLEEAHRAIEAQERVLDHVSQSQPVVFSRKRLQVRVDEAVYVVSLGLVEQDAHDTQADRARGTIEVMEGGQSATMECEILDAPEASS
jgi:biotin-dependent carboxylase-like uncharacterized protein